MTWRLPARRLSYGSSAWLTQATDYFNRVTGYDAVQALKSRVASQDAALAQARSALKSARDAYDAAIDARSKCQRELNGLLQRRETWTDGDVTRLTHLYRSEVTLESEEAAGKARYKSATEDMERAQLDLMSLIRERYIEEQLYSDKIRRASTFWTWGLIGLHLTLFITVQLWLEPGRRRRFQDGIAQLVASQSSSAEKERLAWAEQVRPLVDRLDSTLGSPSLSIPTDSDSVVATDTPTAPQEPVWPVYLRGFASGALVSLILIMSGR